jgi:hypothetical protein
MKAVYTDEALRDLLDIGADVPERYPNIAPDVEKLIRAIVNRIERWSESAPEALIARTFTRSRWCIIRKNCFTELPKIRSRYSIFTTLRVSLGKDAAQGA